MQIDVVFLCGCDGAVDPDKVSSPSCPVHRARVARTVNAPAPRIVGHARGPLVQTKNLGAIDVSKLMRPTPESVPVGDGKDAA